MIRNKKIFFPVFILFFLIVLIFGIQNVHAVGQDQSDSRDNKSDVTLGKERILYTLAEYKCIQSKEKYSGCIKNKDNSYSGIKGEDYDLSSRNIRYDALIIAKDLPGYTNGYNDFASNVAKPDYVTQGANISIRSIVGKGTSSNPYKVQENKAKSPTSGLNTVLLYLHRITPDIETYKNSRTDTYYKLGSKRDTLAFDTNDDGNAANNKSSLVNNMTSFKAPSQQFTYSTVPDVLGYEGSGEFANGKTMITVMDEMNGFPVPVTIDNGNTGLFSLNGDILKNYNTASTSEAAFPLVGGSRKTSYLMANKEYGYTPFTIYSPLKNARIRIDYRGSATVDASDNSKHDGLLAAFYEMGGPQYIASMQMAKSEALTQRNSVYNFMAGLYQNGNYLNYTIHGNNGSKYFWNTSGVMDKTISDAKSKTNYVYGGTAAFKDPTSLYSRQIKYPNLVSTCGSNSAISNYCSSGRILTYNQNFKGSSTSLIRTTTLDGATIYIDQGHINGTKRITSGVGKIYNYYNQVQPKAYNVKITNVGSDKRTVNKPFLGFDYLPNGQKINTNSMMNSSFYYGYYEDRYGVWRTDGYSPLLSSTSGFFPNDTTEFPKNVNNKVINWSGKKSSQDSQSDDHLTALMRYPWKKIYAWTASGDNSKKYLNSYLLKSIYKISPPSNGNTASFGPLLQEEYDRYIDDIQNILKTYPEMFYRLLYLNDEMLSKPMNDHNSGNKTGASIGTAAAKAQLQSGVDANNNSTSNYSFTYPAIPKARMQKMLSELSSAFTDGKTVVNNTYDFVHKVNFNASSNNKYSNTWDVFQDVLKRNGGGQTTYYEDLMYIYLNYFALKQHADNYNLGQSFSLRNGGLFYNDMQFLDATSSDELILNEETRFNHAIVGNKNEQGNPTGVYASDVTDNVYGQKYGTEVYLLNEATGDIITPGGKDSICPNGYKDEGDVCTRIIYANLNRSCPAGYIFDEKKLKCVESTSVPPSCSDGYTLEDGRCVQEDEAKIQCDTNNGFEWNASTNKCERKANLVCSKGILTDIKAEENLNAVNTWDTFNDLYNDWSVTNGNSITNESNGILSYNITTPDSFVTDNSINISSDRFNYVQIKASNGTSGEIGQVYFKTSSSNEYDENKSVSFKMNSKQSGSYTVYTVKLSDNNMFTDDITGLRVDLGNNGNIDGKVKIDWIKIGKFDDDYVPSYKCITEQIPNCPQGSKFENGTCVVSDGNLLNDHLTCVNVPVSSNQVAKPVGFSVGSKAEFNFTNSAQKFTAPVEGDYYFEAWGAQGGGGNSTVNGSNGGKGAYAAGLKHLKKGDVVYVYVGGKGSSAYSLNQGGGYNGGGNGSGVDQNIGYGGGGATDFRTSSLYENRFLVAGGGGGSDNTYAAAIERADDGSGGYGGGGDAYCDGRIDYAECQNTGGSGPFGYGQSATSAVDTGGGGGGYYGGRASNYNNGGGGGGSSYTGGVTHGFSRNGSQLMLSPSDTSANASGEYGHTGNGYARITLYASGNDTSSFVTKYGTVPGVSKYGYTGGNTVFTAPVTGNYKLETWGAQGGSNYFGIEGGKGSYASGYIHLNKNEKLTVSSGGKGGSTSGSYPGSGGYNGGGTGGYGTRSDTYGAGGGGYSAILYNGNIVVLASGGGGAGGSSNNGSPDNVLSGGSLGGPGDTDGIGGIGTPAGGKGYAGTVNSGGSGGYGASATSTSSHDGKYYPGGGGGGGSGFYGGGGGGGGSTKRYSSNYYDGKPGSSGSYLHGGNGGNGGPSITAWFSGGGGSGAGGASYVNSSIASNGIKLNGSQEMHLWSSGYDVGNTGSGYAKISGYNISENIGYFVNPPEDSKFYAYCAVMDKSIADNITDYTGLNPFKETETVDSCSNVQPDNKASGSDFNPVTYNYSGSDKTFTAQYSGRYKLETWGAQGGSNYFGIEGGKGSYASGYVYLNKGQSLIVSVGGKGGSTSGSYPGSGGYNNGGTGGYGTRSNTYGAGGGGYTSIGIIKSQPIILASGGGGAGGSSNNGSPGVVRNNGAVGGSGDENGNVGYGTPAGGKGYAGTVTSGGSGGYGASATSTSSHDGKYYPGGGGGGGSGFYGGGGGGGGSTKRYDSSYYDGESGSSGSYLHGGKGGDGGPSITAWFSGGGGSGAGGASYIFTSSSYKPSNYSVSNAFYMDNTNIQHGQRSGNGTAKITLISQTPDTEFCLTDIEYIDLKYTCPSGTKYDSSKKSCVSEEKGLCPSGYTLNSATGICVKTEKPTCSKTIVSDEYPEPGTHDCENGFVYDSDSGMCKYKNNNNEDEAELIDPGDPDGGWKCVRTKNPVCPSEEYTFNEDNGLCEKDGNKEQDTKVCPDGYSVTSDKSACQKQVSLDKSAISDTLNLSGKDLNISVGKTYLIRNYYAYNPSSLSSLTVKTTNQNNGTTIYHTKSIPQIDTTFELHSEQVDPTGTCRNSTETSDKCASNFSNNDLKYTVNTTPITMGNVSPLDSNKKWASGPNEVINLGDEGETSALKYLWADDEGVDSTTYSKLMYSTADLIVKFDKDQFCYTNKIGITEKLNIANGKIQMTCIPYPADSNNHFIKSENGKNTLDFDTVDIRDKAKINSLAIHSLLVDEDKSLTNSKKASEAENTEAKNDNADIVTGFMPESNGDLYIDKFEVWDASNMEGPQYSFQAMSKENCTNGYDVGADGDIPFTQNGNSSSPGVCEPVYPANTTFKLDATKNYFAKIYVKYVKVADEYGNIDRSVPAYTRYVSLDIKHSGSKGMIPMFPITMNNVKSKDSAYPVVIRSANLTFKDTSTGTLNQIFDKYSVPFDITKDGIIMDSNIGTAPSGTITMQYPVLYLGRNHTADYFRAIQSEFANGSNYKILDTSSALTIPAAKISNSGILDGLLSATINGEMARDNKYVTWDYFPFKYQLGDSIDNKVTIELRCKRNGRQEIYKTEEGACTRIDYTNASGTLDTNCDVYSVDERISGNGDTTTSMHYSATSNRTEDIDASDLKKCLINGPTVTGTNLQKCAYVNSAVIINKSKPTSEVKLGTVNTRQLSVLKTSVYYDPTYNKYIDSYLPNNKDDGCWMFNPVDYAVSKLQVNPSHIKLSKTDADKTQQFTGTYDITKVADSLYNRNVGITYWFKTNGKETQCSPASPTNDVGNMAVGDKHTLSYNITCPIIKNDIIVGNKTVNPVLEVRINGGLNGPHAFNEMTYTNNYTDAEIFADIKTEDYSCTNGTCRNNNRWNVNFNYVYTYGRQIVNYQTNTSADMKWSDHSLGTSENDSWTNFNAPTGRDTTTRSPVNYLAYDQRYGDRQTKTNLCTDYRSGNRDCWRYEQNVSHNIRYYKRTTAQTKYYATRQILDRASGNGCASNTQSGWGTANGGSGNSTYYWGNSTTNGSIAKNSGCHGYTKSTGSQGCPIDTDWWGNKICESSASISSENIPDYIPNGDFNKTLYDGGSRSETTNNNSIHLYQRAKQAEENGSGWVTQTKYMDVCTNDGIYYDVKYSCPGGYTYSKGSRRARSQTSSDGKAVCSASSSSRTCSWKPTDSPPQANEWWPDTGELYESSNYDESRGNGSTFKSDTNDGFACYSKSATYNYICDETMKRGDVEQEVDCDDKEYIGNGKVVCKNVKKNYRCAYTNESCYSSDRERDVSCSTYDCSEDENGKTHCKRDGEDTDSYHCYSGSDNGWVSVNAKGRNNSHYKNEDNRCYKKSCDDREDGGGFDEWPKSNDKCLEATYYTSNDGLWCEEEEETSGQYRYGSACYNKTSENRELSDPRCVNWEKVSYKEIKYYDTESPTQTWKSRTYDNSVKIWQYTCSTNTPTESYPGHIVPVSYSENLTATAEIRTERSKADPRNNSTDGWITLNTGSNSKEANPRGGEWFEVRFTVKYSSNRGQRPGGMTLSNYYNNYHNITSGVHNDTTSPVYDHNGLENSNGSVAHTNTSDVINDADWGYCSATPGEPYGCDQSDYSSLGNLHFGRPGNEQNGHSEVEGNVPSWKSHTGGSGTCYYGPDNKKAWKNFDFMNDIGAKVDVCKGNSGGQCAEENKLASKELEATKTTCTNRVDGLCVAFTKVYEPQASYNNGVWRRGFYVPVDMDVSTASIQVATEHFNAIGQYEKNLLSGAYTERGGGNYFSATQPILPLCACENWPIVLKDGEISWASTETTVE